MPDSRAFLFGNQTRDNVFWNFASGVNGGYFHYLHHRYFDCNYGNEGVPLDKWFGSLHDGSPAAHAAMRARKRKLGNRGAPAAIDGACRSRIHMQVEVGFGPAGVEAALLQPRGLHRGEVRLLQIRQFRAWQQHTDRARPLDVSVRRSEPRRSAASTTAASPVGTTGSARR